MRPEVHAVAAFVCISASAAFGLGLAFLGHLWGAVLAGGALSVAAILLVVL